MYELKVILPHILPAHSLSSKLVNENILCKVFLTQSPGRQIQETNINADFQEFLSHFSLCRLSLNLVVLHPDTSLFRSSKILKCRNRVVFISNVFYKTSTRAWDTLITHHFGRMLSTNTGGKI